MKTALLDDRVLYERAPFDHPALPLISGPDVITVPAVGSAGRAQPLLTFEDLLNTPTIVLSSSFTAPATIALTATTSGSITQVKFFNGPTLLSTVTAAPYTYTWTNVPPGTYSITAKANGTIATAPTTITVSSITLSRSFLPPSTILLTANTTGPVIQVEFFNGPILLTTITTAPYSSPPELTP